jgi:hypothetical protein
VDVGPSAVSSSSLGTATLEAPEPPAIMAPEPAFAPVAEPEPHWSEVSSSTPTSGRRGIEFDFDSDRQEIRVRASYVSALVTVFAVIVVVAMAYLLGRQGVRSSSPVLAAIPTEELRQLPAHPSVLDISRPVADATDAATPAKAMASDAKPETTSAERNAAAAAPAFNEPKPSPTMVVDDAKRAIGLNYVIVQSYPDQKSASDARDILVKSGIPCTVEKGPAGWASLSWYSVVGTTGFDRIRNSPEYDKYVKSIRAVGSSFAGNSKFKKFEPQPYRWKDNSDGGRG